VIYDDSPFIINVFTIMMGVIKEKEQKKRRELRITVYIYIY
jgi:hypothetical protein